MLYIITYVYNVLMYMHLNNGRHGNRTSLTLKLNEE